MSDAERYRFLREEGLPWPNVWTFTYGKDLDAAVDARMKELAKPQCPKCYPKSPAGEMCRAHRELEAYERTPAAGEQGEKK